MESRTVWNFLSRFRRSASEPISLVSHRSCPCCGGQMHYESFSRMRGLYLRVCHACDYVDPMPVKMRNQKPFLE
jgi:hypothetical protein